MKNKHGTFLGPLLATGLLAFSAVSLLSACGDDDSTADDDIVVADAAPVVDAPPPPPDAFVCGMTACGEGPANCVDTATNDDHCGDCDTACSPAAGCGGSECSCPGAFVPATLNSVFGMVQPMNEDVFAITVFPGSDGGTHVLLAQATPAQVTLGEAIDLSDPQAPVGFLIGYNVDLQAQGVEGGFGPVDGTITFDYVCAAGMSATITMSNMIEVDANSGNPLAGGCTQENITTAFAVGDDCSAATPDAAP